MAALSGRNSDSLPAKGHSPRCFDHCRYWMVFITVLSMTLVMGNTFAFNFTVICMEQPPPQAQWSNPNLNQSNQAASPDYNYRYTSFEKSLLFSAAALGGLLSSLPITHFITRFGLKHTVLAYSWLATVASFLLPVTARWGLLPLLVVRTLQGVGLSPLWSMVGAVNDAWAPLAVSGTYTLLLTLPFPVGLVKCGS